MPHPLLRFLHLAAADGVADAELLRRFAEQGDEAAFELLVRRHADLVWKVCRGVLRQDADAEDAFQAAFLALAKKAGTIRADSTLGGWLHRVAVHAALKLRAKAARVSTADLSHLPAARESDAAAILHEELARLGDPYRMPVLLCDLEGHTHAEAAKLLGWPVGTVSGRLSRAREQLRHRLERRGVLVTPLVVASAGGASGTLVRSAVSAAGGSASPAVVSLTNGVLLTMRTTKLKLLAAVCASVAGFVGAGSVLVTAGGSEPRPVATKAASAPKAPEPVHSPIRGTWTTELVFEEVFDDEVIQKEQTVTVVITDSRIVYLDKDGFADEQKEMSYTINPAGKPAAIDTMNPRLERTSDRGIYRLDGDRLQLYFGAKPGERPTGFPAPAELAHSALFTELKRIDPNPIAVKHRYPNAPGCFWIEPPRTPAATLSLGGPGLVILYEKNANGAAVVTVASAVASDGRPCPEYRPVLLDANDKQYRPALRQGAGAGGLRDGAMVNLQQWRMDPKVLSADKVKRLGIEQVTAEAHRAAARQAVQQATQRGVDALPYPEIGKPYSFTVTASDGTTVSSRDWRGKVIVIDWWATWCGPCVTELSRMKELYRTGHAGGLELLGVNLDHDEKAARQTSARLGLKWPQVYVPDDEKLRKLWQTAADIVSIPHVLLIDRKGVLRAVNPPDLHRAVAELLQEK